MSKQVLKLLVVVFSMIFFIEAANAMQLNLTLGEALKSNQSSLIMKYTMCATNTKSINVNCESRDYRGIQYKLIPDVISLTNEILKDKHPGVNYDSQSSQLTLGYIKDGASIYPDSCEHLELKEVTNITLTESGCAVS